MWYPVVHAHHSTTVDKSTWQRPCIRPFIQHSWQRQYARLCTLAANNTDESNKSLIVTIGVTTHSQIWHYFISYLLTCEVDLFEVLEIMAQMWHYIYQFVLAINQQRWLQTLWVCCAKNLSNYDEIEDFITELMLYQWLSKRRR